MRANLGQDRDKLSRGEHCWCAAPNIDGLDGTACGYVLLRRQSDLMNEGLDKGLCAALAMDFKIKGAESRIAADRRGCGGTDRGEGAS